MTYITLSNDMRLMVTKSTPIYRGDNISSAITFLLPVRVNSVDMSTATVFLSYIRADGEPDMVILEQSPEKYNANYYQYVLPVTCKLSRYPGQVCMWFQICDGVSKCPIIAKTGECTIRIHESKSMDGYLGDHQLTALYQMKKRLDAVSEDINDDCIWEDMDDDNDGTWEDMESSDEDDDGSFWENM